MQINNNGVTNNTNSSANSQKAGPTAKVDKANAAAPADSNDSVQLSQAARVMTELEAKVISSTDVDTAKVERLQQAVADGSYNIDPEKIADKMLGSDQLF